VAVGVGGGGNGVCVGRGVAVGVCVGRGVPVGVCVGGSGVCVGRGVPVGMGCVTTVGVAVNVDVGADARIGFGVHADSNRKTRGTIRIGQDFCFCIVCNPIGRSAPILPQTGGGAQCSMEGASHKTKPLELLGRRVILLHLSDKMSGHPSSTGGRGCVPRPTGRWAPTARSLLAQDAPRSPRRSTIRCPARASRVPR
jgi:hypothetical protein